MEIIHSAADWREIRTGHSILGFVPTMGAIHPGHLALVRRCKADNDTTVVSIFVNPAQFNDPRDFESYPRTLDEDIELLENEETDYLFMPSPEELYADDYCFKVVENDFSSRLCGKNRPGHFDGVLTVVLKFLNIIAPKRAYFGEKDYQQFLLIKDMAKAFFLPIEIISVPTAREKDGLALSSRNQLLSDEQRVRVAVFPEILKEAANTDEAAALLEKAGLEVDYVEEMFQRRFGAIRISNVRLIDNVPL